MSMLPPKSLTQIIIEGFKKLVFPTQDTNPVQTTQDDKSDRRIVEVPPVDTTLQNGDFMEFNTVLAEFNPHTMIIAISEGYIEFLSDNQIAQLKAIEEYVIKFPTSIATSFVALINVGPKWGK